MPFLSVYSPTNPHKNSSQSCTELTIFTALIKFIEPYFIFCRCFFGVVSKTLKTLPKEELYETEEKMVYTLDDKKDEFTVTRNNNEFEVKGEAVDRLIRRINIDDNESMYYLHKNLVNLGVEAELKKQGIKEGDIVKISNYELEWYE